jgi:hypothetical protein
MGILGGLVVYGFGRRRGRKQGRRDEYLRQQASQEAPEKPECINWYHFCRTYGSCDGLKCHYGE